MQITLKNKDRFLRSFLGKVDESTFFRRFGLGGKFAFAGRRTHKGFILYRKKTGIFSLFALTAWGVFFRAGGRDCLSVRFGRCIPLAILWVLWCSLMLFAGVLLLGSFLAFWFIIPAILFALPLFVYSKKEKARLMEFIQGII